MKTLMYKDEDIAKHLRDTNGNLFLTAKRMGCNRTTIYEHIEKNPDLQRVCAEARESVIDLAESTMQKAMLKGDVSACKYILGTIGKKRGYVEKQEVDVTGGITVVIGKEFDEL